MKPGRQRRELWLRHSVMFTAALFVHFAAAGQTLEAISRETSLFNFGQAAATTEAISREVSLFNLGEPSVTTATEAISREVSVFNFGQPAASTTEAISREVSVFNFGVAPPASVEAVSREVSVFNFGRSSANVEAISREVSVFNYGVPPVVFSVGSTNIVGNESNQVPFVLQTVLDLTNLTLTLQMDDSRLQVLGVTPVSSEVVSVGLGAVNSNGHPITFTLDPAVLPPTNGIVAYLNFQGMTNLDSAIVPLAITNFSAIRNGGQPILNTLSNGQVIIIVTKPMLFVTNSPQFGFTMYGVPGATYAVESTTNLVPADWHELERLLESGPTLTISGVPTNAPRQFFRTQQVAP